MRRNRHILLRPAGYCGPDDGRTGRRVDHRHPLSDTAFRSTRNPPRRDALMVLALSVLALLPFYFGTPPDDEEFAFTIVPSLVQAEALRQRSWSGWTSDLGFGLPSSFATSFGYHPFLPLFSRDTLHAALGLTYQVHLGLGAVLLLFTCYALGIGRRIALLCAFSYLFSAPAIQYAHVDFWPHIFMTWTTYPALLFAVVGLLTAATSRSAWSRAALLGLSIGLANLLTHPGHVAQQGAPLAVIALASYGVWKRWRLQVAVAILLSLGISAHRLYVIVDESTRMKPQEVREPQRSDPGLMLWGALGKPFFRPHLSPNADGVEGGVGALWRQYRGINQPLRLPFVGPAFMLAALAYLVFGDRAQWYCRPMKIAFLFTVVMAFMPVGPLMPHAWRWRDGQILLAIVMAGRMLTEARADGSAWRRKLAWATCVAQPGLLVAGVVPAVLPALEQGVHRNPSPDSPVTYRDLVAESELVRALKKGGPRHRRVYLSPAADVRSGLGKDGLYFNSLAAHGLNVVTGVFRGVSTDAFHPARNVLYGQIRAQPEVLVNGPLLDALGIQFVVARSGERYAPSLDVVDRPASLSGAEFLVLRNRTAWPHAVVVRPPIRDLGLPLREDCSHDRLLCADWSAVHSLRDTQAAVDLERAPGRLTLRLPPADGPRLVLVSEMYRPGWQASADVGRASVEPLLGALVGVSIPSGARRVEIAYRPLDRLLLSVVGWGSAIGACWIVAFHGGYRATRRGKELLDIPTASH